MPIDICRVQELREKTGCGLKQCNDALLLFDGNMNQAFEFLRMVGSAVLRGKNGREWSRQDYIDWVKENIK